jgi:hypothetical protein
MDVTGTRIAMNTKTENPKMTRRSPARPPRTNAIKITVSVPTSPYGTPKPQAHIVFPNGTTSRAGSAKPWPYRAARAVMHLAAARAEAHTPETEGWVIELDHGMNIAGPEALAATISIELVQGDAAEAERATKLLRGMAAAFEGATYDHARGLARDSDDNALI